MERNAHQFSSVLCGQSGHCSITRVSVGVRCRSRRWEGGNRPPSPLQDFTRGRPCRTDVPYGLLLQVHTPSSLKPLHRLCLPLGTPCPGSPPRQKSTPSPLTQHPPWDSSATRDRCPLPTQKDGVCAPPASLPPARVSRSRLSSGSSEPGRVKSLINVGPFYTEDSWHH